MNENAANSRVKLQSSFCGVSSILIKVESCELEGDPGRKPAGGQWREGDRQQHWEESKMMEGLCRQRRGRHCCCCCCCCWVASVVPSSVRPHRRPPTGLPCPWDSPGKNTGVGCHCLLQCMKVKSESDVARCVRLLATPWTVAYQAPPSMGFSRQEYWSGLPLPSLLNKHRQPLYLW